MPDEVKDVNPESSTEEEVVKEPEQTTPQEPEQISEEQVTSEPQEVKPEVTPQPDRPEINYAMEALRKVNELTDAFKQSQAGQTQAQQQQPQYSKAQLRTFADSTTDQTQKIWALEEIDKLDKQERQSEMQSLFSNYTKASDAEVKKGQSYQYITQNFPECFVKDAQGNNLGWNNSSPLTQKIGQYMQNKQIAGDPQGLIVAAKMAAFDLGISMNKNLQKKINKTTAELRREQKKTLISGGGVSPQIDVSSKQKQILKLAEEYKKTRDPKIFTQLTKIRGLLPSK